MIYIAELEFDENNEDELARHHITPQEVMQLLQNAFTVRRIEETALGSVS